MRQDHPWFVAKELDLQVAPHIEGGFDIGFDKQVPEEVQEELRSFVVWAEENFRIPVTLYVDFEYRHYLVSREGKRVGYLFYWADFESYPVFDNGDDIPVIRLPVRTERSMMEEVLASFIEAISCYFAWLSNALDPAGHFTPEEADVEEVLQAYWNRE